MEKLKVIERFLTPQNFSFTIEEDEHVQNEIRNLMASSYSITHESIRQYRDLISTRPFFLLRAIKKPWIAIKVGREHKRREKVPAALRNLRQAFHADELPLEAPEVVQVPSRSSLYASKYQYPHWLDDYGVNKTDWEDFAEPIRRASWLNGEQAIISGALALFLEISMLATPPTKVIAVILAPGFPLLIHFRRKNIRRRVRDGTIPLWIAYWNKTFFGPKGLCVGLDLPGPIFEDAAVEPMVHTTPWMQHWKGPFKKPESTEKVAFKARITIAKVKEPSPSAGRHPALVDRISRFHKVYKVRQYPDNVIDRMQESIAKIQRETAEFKALNDEMSLRKRLALSNRASKERIPRKDVVSPTESVEDLGPLPVFLQPDTPSLTWTTVAPAAHPRGSDTSTMRWMVTQMDGHHTSDGNNDSRRKDKGSWSLHTEVGSFTTAREGSDDSPPIIITTPSPQYLQVPDGRTKVRHGMKEIRRAIATT